jgi:hypothetical protein
VLYLNRIRRDLIELAPEGSAAHRLARRANALILLDDGMNCNADAGQSTRKPRRAASD